MPNKDVKDMLDSPRQDENTYWRTWGRIFQNGWQAGSVVGTAVVFPALVAKSEGSGLTDSIDGAGKAAVAGIGLAGACRCAHTCAAVADRERSTCRFSRKQSRKGARTLRAH